MKKQLRNVVSIAAVCCLSGSLFGQTITNQFYDVVAGNGNGLRLWSSDIYKISMGNTADHKLGPVSGYSIKTSMSIEGGRGWTWGVIGLTPVAALDNTGILQLSNKIYLNPVTSRVGIGNIIPSCALDVTGDVKATNLTLSSNLANPPSMCFSLSVPASGATAKYWISNEGNTLEIGGYGATKPTFGAISIDSEGGVGFMNGISATKFYANLDNGMSYTFGQNTAGDMLLIGLDGVETFRIKGSRVGIGVDPSTAAFYLNVKGSSLFETSIKCGGTSSNTSTLSGSNLLFNDATLNTSCTMTYTNDLLTFDNTGYNFNRSTSKSFSITNGTNTDFIINASGNVGIGTSTPTLGKLEVSGSGVANGIAINNGTAGQDFRMYTNGANSFLTRGGNDSYGIVIDPTGNIGIGKNTITSGYRVGISGNLHTTGNIVSGGIISAGSYASNKGMVMSRISNNAELGTYFNNTYSISQGSADGNSELVIYGVNNGTTTQAQKMDLRLFDGDLKIGYLPADNSSNAIITNAGYATFKSLNNS